MDYTTLDKEIDQEIAKLERAIEEAKAEISKLKKVKKAIQ
jgi:hypothetical protein